MRLDRGFTLVEMLIAIVVSSLAVATLYASYDIVQKQYTKIRDIAVLHQSGRNILGIFKRDIRMAGFTYRDNSGKIIYGAIGEPIKITDSGNKCCDDITVTYDYHNEHTAQTERLRIRYWVEDYSGSKGTRGRLYKQTDILASKTVTGQKDVIADYIEDLQFSGDGLSPGPIVYYSFNGNADDRSGNGNDGVAKRVSLTKDKNGQARKAYGFRGAMNEYVIVNNFPDITNDLSITAWIKPGGILSMHPIVTKGYSREPYTLWLLGGSTNTSGGLFFMVNWGTTARLDCMSHNSIKVARDWNHVAAVKDSSDNKVKLFVNGTRTGECNYARPIYSNNEPLYIGSSYPGGHEYYRGDMDEICLFNRALSDKEVATISSTHENSCSSDGPSLISINLILRTKTQYGQNKSYKKKTYLSGNYNIEKNDGYKRDEFSSTVLVRNLTL